MNGGTKRMKGKGWNKKRKRKKRSVAKKSKEKEKKWEGERNYKDWGVKILQMHESPNHMLRHFEIFLSLLYLYLKAFLEILNDSK